MTRVGLPTEPITLGDLREALDDVWALPDADEVLAQIAELTRAVDAMRERLDEALAALAAKASE